MVFTSGVDTAEVSGMQAVTKEQVIEALRVVEDPDVHRSIVELDMVRSVRIKGSKVSVEIALTIKGCPLHAVIESQVRSVLQKLPSVTEVVVTIGTMTDQERERFAAKIRANDVVQAPLLAEGVNTKFITVASGKGGVGKSTVTANLAVAIARTGRRVGVIDADIYGFSLPKLFGVADVKPAIIEDMVMPVQTHGVSLISMHFFVPSNKPVIWRGPMLGKMLRNFFQEVHWGEVDVMLLDLPPGTGDMALDVHSTLPTSRELIVTTPQENAAEVAVRAGVMAQQVKHDVIGVVENMAYFLCPHCGERHHIFGTGGGQAVAATLRTELLGQIPISSTEKGANGIFPEATAEADAFANLAEAVLLKIGLA